MNKRIMTKIGSLALASMLAVPFFTACGDEGAQKPSAQVGNANAEYNLNVYVYEAGFGIGWIEEAAKNFCAKYTNYSVSIVSDAGMFDQLQTEIDAENCLADVALIDDNDYGLLASNGKLADLTDLMNAPLPESDTLIKDVIPQAHMDYRQLGLGAEAKWYGVPWQDQCAPGIIYNKKYFDQHNLQIPTTMDEYFALCNQILDLGDMAPLVYCGAEDGYAMVLPNQWLIEYYGYEYMTETFFKYDNWQYYEATETGRQKAYTTLARMLRGEDSQRRSYALAGSESMSSTVAQQRFISADPKAAMYICGPWLPTEEATKLNDLGETFEYGFFGLPHINSNKKDASGNDSSNVRYSLASNSLVVPKTSKNKAGAKLFIAELYANASLTDFVESNCGVSRPMTFTPDVSGINTSTNKGAFAKQVYDYYKGSAENPTQMVYEVSTAKMAGRLAPCMFGGENQHIVRDVIAATSYSDARAKVNGAAKNETEKVKSYWDFNANNWKAIYLR